MLRAEVYFLARTNGQALFNSVYIDTSDVLVGTNHLAATRQISCPCSRYP